MSLTSIFSRRHFQRRLAADAALVVVFAFLGRGAHGELLDLPSLATTAWPFLVGLGAGWSTLALRARGATTALPPQWDPRNVRWAGITIWATTLIGGLAFWSLQRGSVAHWSFAVVAGTFLAVFLLGSRELSRRWAQRETARAH